MGLTRLALIRPVAISMLFFALAAMGIVAYTRLPVERFPPISFPFVNVFTQWPGAAPEDVESLVTKVIENAVIGINGIDTITSDSNFGSSRVGIRFLEGTDVNQAAIDVGRKVNQVRRRLPADIVDPSISKADVSNFPVMNIAVSSDKLKLPDLTQAVNDNIQPLIQSIPGVADASVSGGATRQIQVRVDTSKLRSYGLSLTQVQNALTNQNVGLPGGPIRTQLQVFNTRTQALAQQPADLNYIVINTPAGGGGIAPTTATNPANPSGQSASASSVGLNGAANIAVGISVTIQSGTNSLKLAEDVRKLLDKLQASMAGSGITFRVVNDQTIFTRAAVDDVQRNLYLAILLTAAVLMVLVSIPTSLVSTFFVMYILGFNLDTMSLMALALLIGILVDDSIVVLENINRHLGMGEKPWDAALNGRTEIGLAAITITVTDVVVYTPVAFMAGNIGQLFREFGLTIVAATMCSLLVSFTLTPMLASRLLKGEALEHITGSNPWARFTRAWERQFHRVKDGYRGLLERALRVRWLPVAVGFGMLALVISFLPLHILGTEFTPQEDNNVFNVQIQMPVGTALSATDQAVRQLEGELMKMPEVVSVYATVGGGGGPGGGASEQNASITVGLVDKGQRSRSVFDIIQQVRRIGANVPGAQVRTNVPNTLVGGGGSPIQVVIRGQDFSTMQNITNQVLDIVRNTPGTTELRTSRIQPAPEYRAVVDRQKAGDQGVTAQTIANTLRAAVQGVLVSQLRPAGQDQTDIYLQLKGAETLSPDELAAIPILTTKGTVVRLDQVATIQRASSPASIQRYNRAREIEVQGNVSGRALGDVLRDIREQTSKLELPVGYTVEIGGQGSQLDRAIGALSQALGLSVVLMYMPMAALYESFLFPLAVMICLPVALVGAFLGLLAMARPSTSSP